MWSCLYIDLHIFSPLTGSICDNYHNYYRNSIYEALREKVSILGRFQEIRLKFHILKIDFLNEKILFFDLDFFPDKILLCSVRKWALQRLPKLNSQIGTATFQYLKNFASFSVNIKKNRKILQILKGGCANLVI